MLKLAPLALISIEQKKEVSLEQQLDWSCIYLFHTFTSRLQFIVYLYPALQKEQSPKARLC